MLTLPQGRWCKATGNAGDACTAFGNRSLQLSDLDADSANTARVAIRCKPVAPGPDLAHYFAADRRSGWFGSGACALHPSLGIPTYVSIQNLSLLCKPFKLHTRAPEAAWPTRPGIADLYLYAHAGPDIRLAGNDEVKQDMLDRIWSRAAAS